MTDLLERLRDRGWRLTAQRRAVAEVLGGAHVHLTADEVLERAVAVVPEVSRATVYNTLRELVDIGELREVSIDGRAKRYDPNVTGPHHHLMCTGCGLILDVPGGDPGGIPRGERHGFVVDEVEVTYRGRCPRCRAA
ncbi:MAG: hydrogen peroxide sensitive repressor [Acidimicrobiales bacterium]|nr:hydrogen peroxide sensitive repressor [Acidimicrobiales bacterium]